MLEGSSIEVGSSASSTAGSMVRALAMDTLCFCPPERVFILLFRKLSSPGRPTSTRAETAVSFSRPSFARSRGSDTA